MLCFKGFLGVGTSFLDYWMIKFWLDMLTFTFFTRYNI